MLQRFLYLPTEWPNYLEYANRGNWLCIQCIVVSIKSENLIQPTFQLRLFVDVMNYLVSVIL